MPGDDSIEPVHFDAIVVSSGLPEVLLASALARAGRSVLLLEPGESYGASWGSLSGSEFVHGLVNPELLAQQQQQQQQQQQGQRSACGFAAGSDAAAGALELPLEPVRPLGRLEPGALLLAHPGLQDALWHKGLVVDLAPKALYQDEALVAALVRCQAHHYLEFKLVEGSYIFTSGRLRPVPASRAELFADKALALQDKRCLGRFLAGCAEAMQGYGRLKGEFGDRPLVELLEAEGLSEQLQQVVLYGIAMADTPQQQQQQQREARSRRPLTAAAALASLQLYGSSAGKYGGRGAFMVPCYGCGSMPEAFVRLAAVKGCVTALRHAAVRLTLLPAAERRARGAAAAEQQQQQQLRQQEGATPACSGSEEEERRRAADLAATVAAARLRIELSTGQRLTTNALVACRDTIAPAGGAGGVGAQQLVACATALLDGSVVDGDGSLLLVFPPGSLPGSEAFVVRGLQLAPGLSVAPPGVYVLYLSAVLPGSDDHSSHGGGGGSLAERALAPALAALATGAGLEAVSVAPEGAARQAAGGDAAEQGPTAADAPATAANDGQQGGSAEPAAAEPPARDLAERRPPRVLAACYHALRCHRQQYCTLEQQQQQQQREGAESNTGDQGSSGGSSGAASVLLCPAAPPGVAGYTRVMQAAEAAFRQHFPGLPWLTDELPAAAAAAAGVAEGEAGDGGGATAAASVAGVLDDGELDAIDELTAALAELSALAPSEPPVQS